MTTFMAEKIDKVFRCTKREDLPNIQNEYEAYCKKYPNKRVKLEWEFKENINSVSTPISRKEAEKMFEANGYSLSKKTLFQRIVGFFSGGETYTKTTNQIGNNTITSVSAINHHMIKEGDLNLCCKHCNAKYNNPENLKCKKCGKPLFFEPL